MRKVILKVSYTVFLFISVCSLSGCKKSDAELTDDSYMRFKLNGVKKEYNTCSAQFLGINVNNLYVVSIGATSSADPSNSFGIHLNNKTEPVQGASFTGGPVAGTLYPQATMGYIVGTKVYPSASTFDVANAQVSVNITELSSTHVKGNFSCNLYPDTGGFATVVYTITEGEFYSPRY